MTKGRAALPLELGYGCPRSQKRDLGHPSICCQSSLSWKRCPPLCHPERRRGICSSADLAWRCFRLPADSEAHIFVASLPPDLQRNKPGFIRPSLWMKSTNCIVKSLVSSLIWIVRTLRRPCGTEAPRSGCSRNAPSALFNRNMSHKLPFSRR
jgi:hypothetical protein